MTQALDAVTIEACAKIADGYVPQHEGNQPVARNVARNIAAAIRTLAAAPTEKEK